MLGPRELGARSPGTEACQPERPVLALCPDHGWETLARGGEARGPLQLFHPSGQEHWGQTDLLPGSATLPSRPETCYRGPAPQPRPGLWAQRLRRPGDRWDWEAAPRLTRSRGQSPTALSHCIICMRCGRPRDLWDLSNKSPRHPREVRINVVILQPGEHVAISPPNSPVPATVF